jgi:hypothetical protein
MNRVLPARRWIALGLLLAACAAPALRPSSAQPRPSADASAFLFVSPNTHDDLDLVTARQRIDTPDHARYRRLAGTVLSELGVREYRVTDAVGEWQGSAENSLFVTIHEPVEPATVACAAAWFGLAARQKAVLAFRVGSGEHVVAVIDLPGKSLADARELLDRHGFAERTLIARGDGWRAVVLAESRQRRALERVPGARVRAGRGVTIGAPTADGARERYREVIRAYHAPCEVPLAKLGW